MTPTPHDIPAKIAELRRLLAAMWKSGPLPESDNDRLALKLLREMDWLLDAAEHAAPQPAGDAAELRSLRKWVSQFIINPDAILAEIDVRLANPLLVVAAPQGDVGLAIEQLEQVRWALFGSPAIDMGRAMALCDKQIAALRARPPQADAREELVRALHDLVDQAKKPEPFEIGSSGNCGDDFDYGCELGSWSFAQEVRAAMSSVAPQPKEE